MTEHQGRHHFEAGCGEYRPAPGVTCETCPPACPSCGSFYRPTPDAAAKYPVPEWLGQLRDRLKAQDAEESE